MRTGFWHISGALQLGCALMALGCSSAEPSPPQVTVLVESDLPLVSHIKVELLDVSAQEVAREQWFEVGCDGAAGSRGLLGSFGIQKARLDTARVRVSGYQPDASGALRLLVQRRVNGRFGPGSIQVELASACAGQLDCPAEQTCDPASGSCAAIPTLSPRAFERSVPDCLTASEPPLELLDGGESNADAGVLDAAAADDAEAAAEDAEAELDAEEQDAEPSDAMSAEASLAAPEGGCSDSDFRVSNDPARCGGCNLVCSTEHIDVSCTLGRCDGQCAPGFRDCNGDKLTDGCETDLSQPDHCGLCSQICPYGVCTDYECKGELANGYFNTQATQLWGFEGMLFVRVSLPPGRLIKLGLLTERATSVGMTHLRLGLYYDGNNSSDVGIVGELLAFTDALLVRDATLGSGPGGNARGTEGAPIAPYTLPAARNYWIGILPSGPLSVYIEPEPSAPVFSWNAPEIAYPGLPGSQPPFPLEALSGPRIGVYAVIDPSP